MLLPDNRPFAIYGKEGITLHSLEISTSVVITARDGSPVPGESISINEDGDTVAFFSNVAGLTEEPDSECPEQMAGDCAWLYIYEVTTESFWRAPVVAVWPPMADTAVSADGRYLAFAAPQALSQEGVFLYDGTSAMLTPIHTGDTTTSDFAAGVGGTLVDISADGRFVAFASPDNGIVPEDTNGVSDVFVYDRDTVQIERISTPREIQASHGPNGFQFVPNTGGGRETGLSISADGRYVVFMSAANLAGGELATCRSIWDLASHNFGLCALPAPSTPGAAGWKAVG